MERDLRCSEILWLTSSPSTRLGIFNEIISNYTSRELSQDLDSLNAVSAILQRMQRTRLCPCGLLYGLPLIDFRSALAWHQKWRGGTADLSFYKWVEARRRSYMGIPSWSWAAWKLKVGLDRDDDDVTHGHVQPPLKVSTAKGRKLDVDLVLSETNQRRDAVIDLKTEEVRALVFQVQRFYQQLQATGPSEVLPHPGLSSAGRENSILEVEGLLLTLPITVEQLSWSDHWSPVYPGLELLNRKLCGHDMWYMDGDCSDLGSPGKTTNHEFLLVSLQSQKDTVELWLLFLVWEESLAVRRGVAELQVK